MEVEATEGEKGVTITITKEKKYCLAKCPYFDDWAQGETYWQALQILAESLEDKYRVLKGEKGNLGKAMDEMLERFEKGGK